MESNIKDFEKVQFELSLELLRGKFVNQLRSCTAYVYRTEHYYVLRSYNTIVACIDIANNIMYDFLRKVYGYTNTSAKHINYFYKDYGTRTTQIVTFK